MPRKKTSKKRRAAKYRREPLSESVWRDIKADYLRGVPPKELRAKYQVKEHTLKNRICVEKWRDQKRELGKKAEQETIPVIVAEMADLQKDVVSLQYSNARDMIDRGMEALKMENTSAAMIMAGVAAVKTGYQLARQAIGLQSEGNGKGDGGDPYDDDPWELPPDLKEKIALGKRTIDAGDRYIDVEASVEPGTEGETETG